MGIISPIRTNHQYEYYLEQIRLQRGISTQREHNLDQKSDDDDNDNDDEKNESEIKSEIKSENTTPIDPETPLTPSPAQSTVKVDLFTKIIPYKEGFNPDILAYQPELEFSNYDPSFFVSLKLPTKPGSSVEMRECRFSLLKIRSLIPKLELFCFSLVYPLYRDEIYKYSKNLDVYLDYFKKIEKYEKNEKILKEWVEYQILLQQHYDYHVKAKEYIDLQQEYRRDIDGYNLQIEKYEQELFLFNQNNIKNGKKIDLKNDLHNFEQIYGKFCAVLPTPPPPLPPQPPPLPTSIPTKPDGYFPDYPIEPQIPFILNQRYFMIYMMSLQDDKSKKSGQDKNVDENLKEGRRLYSILDALFSIPLFEANFEKTNNM